MLCPSINTSIFISARKGGSNGHGHAAIQALQVLGGFSRFIDFISFEKNDIGMIKELFFSYHIFVVIF